jgi:hypothetical protein
MQSLAPCPSCSRHVRVVDRSCPFCDQPFDAPRTARVVDSSNGRVGRAAVLFLGAALAACGGAGAAAPAPDPASMASGYGGPGMSSDEPQAPGAGPAAGPQPASPGTARAATGAEDAGATTGSQPDAGGDMAPLYGGAPPDESAPVADAGVGSGSHGGRHHGATGASGGTTGGHHAGPPDHEHNALVAAYGGPAMPSGVVHP